MLNESGHLNPTFKLARALRERGHDVRYLATEDARAIIEAQGFVVEPLFPDLFPRGVLARDEALGTLARRRTITRRYRSLLDRLEKGAPVATRPDLLLADVTQPHYALWAHRAGQPFMQVNTSLPQTKDSGVPPLRSSAPFGATLRGRVASDWAWRKFVTKRRVEAAAASLIGMRPPYDLARAAAARFSVRTRELDCETVYMPQLRGVPELVFCPSAFDFERAAQPHRHYVASIDLTRSEPEFAWGGLSSGRPLVYCALGGQRYRADAVPGFFRRVVRAFAANPQWELLLAVGKHMHASDIDAPSNVVVVDRAPQLAALQRARVMITHAGLGSVKECIMNAVPMLGVPLDVDQPGNAARIVHHGLGLMLDVQTGTEHDIATALGRLLEEPAYRLRVASMRSAFEETEASDLGVRLVEQQLASVRG